MALLPNPYFAINTRLPFLRREALAVGFDPARRRGGFRKVFRGVYVDEDVVTNIRLCALAALALHPEGCFVSHQTAAQLRGLPVPHCERIHVSVWKQEHRTRQLGIAPHVAYKDSAVEVVDGLRMTEPLDLFIELAGVLPLVDLVVVGDEMVSRGMFTPEGLRQFCASTDRKNARKARRGAGFVRAGVDSPMETRLRMLLVLAGLPEPRVNLTIYDDHGQVRYRLDLAFPEHCIIVEYDGRQHAEDTVQWNSDIARREDLEAAGWTIIVVTSKGIYQQPGNTIRRVGQALRRKGCRVDPLSQDWKPHFPSR